MQMYGHMFINVRFNIFIFIFIISVLLCRPFFFIHPFCSDTRFLHYVSFKPCVACLHATLKGQFTPKPCLTSDICENGLTPNISGLVSVQFGFQSELSL